MYKKMNRRCGRRKRNKRQLTNLSVTFYFLCSMFGLSIFAKTGLLSCLIHVYTRVSVLNLKPGKAPEAIDIAEPDGLHYIVEFISVFVCLI